MSSATLVLLATCIAFGLATIWLVEGFLIVTSFLVRTGKLTKHRMELLVRQLAAASAVVMVASAAFVYAQGSGADVHHDQVTFGLPVFVGSLIAVAGFVWAVARWDAKRETKIDRLEQKVDELIKKGTHDAE